MIVEIILWWSEIPVGKTFLFIKVDLKFVSKRSIKLEYFEFLKQFGSKFKGESVDVSKNWLRTGLLVVALKSSLRITFSYLFVSLHVMVLRLVVRSVSLRLDGLYIPARRILFLHFVISIVRISMSEPSRQLHVQS